MQPGVQAMEIDRIARSLIVSRGYEEFPHALGHQVGLFAHDGTVLLGPLWEKYGSKPLRLLEEGMVFTLEPRLTVPGHGIVTVEEMVVVRATGAEFLSVPQQTLRIIPAT
jgi:Xaa-Pro aminopeptidase